ncbi:RCC1 domain-containing protein [Dactylosporangium sp. NPDC048998]|uniref:RCC1 domain-containing protein n=1 Tax=Dactylosporangium sp. NPDC048998 TaxID=3363976 RepID=UPI00371C2EBF
MTRKLRLRIGLAVATLAAAVGAVAFPAPASAAPTWRTVDTGYDTSCGIKTDNTLWCWGFDYGMTPLGIVPTKITTPGLAWASVSVGSGHVCALTTVGYAYCFGSNVFGQLGTHDQVTSPTPRAVYILGTFVSISAGATHTCAIDTFNQLYCWGDGRGGLLGLGTQTQWSTPHLVGAGWKSVSAGMYATCAINTAGKAYCWGANNHSQLGTGTPGDRWSPAPVASSDTWLNIAAGGGHSCGVTSLHQMYCWGSNMSGEMGNDTSSETYTSVPTRVGSTSNWARVDVGSDGGSYPYQEFTCGLYSDGTRFCWGYNIFGQLGIGDSINRNAPRRWLNEGTWSAVTTGRRHACGIKSNGSLQCWGYNYLGQLGVGDTNDRWLPTEAQ